MCLAIYLASPTQLTLIPRIAYSKEFALSDEFKRVAQRFHTAELTEDNEAVRERFDLPFIVYAGAYEQCGCAFNYGREYPDYEDDPDALQASRESVKALVDYVSSSNVRQIYACWFGDESLPHTSIRRLSVAELTAPSFYFKEQELITC